MNMIYWLAVGAFAVGTEAFMVSAILPDISKDLQVSATGRLLADIRARSRFGCDQTLYLPIFCISSDDTGHHQRRVSRCRVL
jgi:hypothetical protein